MIVLNATAQLAALLAVIITQAAYSIAAARLLGVSDFGQFSFVFSITQILLIGCDLGLHNTAIRKIALCLGQSSHTEYGESHASSWRSATNLFGTFFSIKVIVSLGLVGVAGLISTQLSGTSVRFALLLFSGGMFFQSLNIALNVTFQAHGKLYLGSLNNALMALLNLSIGITFVLFGGRVMALGAAYMLAMAVAFLLNYKIFERYIHPICLGTLFGWREFVRESLPVGAGTLFNTIASRIDITLLALMVGSYQTGIYSAAYRIYGSLLNIPIAIFSAILPAMASLGEKREGVRALFHKSIASMLMIAVPLALVLSGLAGVLIQTLYGSVYAQSAEVLKILAWSLIAAFTGMAFSHVILSQAVLVNRLPGVAAAAMTANIVMNLFLIPKMGHRGAAFSTLGTEILLAMMYAIAAGHFLFGKYERIEFSENKGLNRTFRAPPSSKESRV